MTDYEEMRERLMRKTVKELRALARAEGISLGYDASRKETCVEAIVSNRRYRELEGVHCVHHDGSGR